MYSSSSTKEESDWDNLLFSRKSNEDSFQIEDLNNHSNNLLSSGNLNAEIADLRLKLEEKSIELDQRNLLLSKAKSAIEALKSETEKLRSESMNSLKKTEYNEMILTLKESHERELSDLKLQLNQSKLVIENMKKEFTDNEAVRISTEKRMVSLLENIEILKGNKDHLEESCKNYKDNITQLKDELIQSRAHVELYEIQINEYTEEINNLKVNYYYYYYYLKYD